MSHQDGPRDQTRMDVEGDAPSDPAATPAPPSTRPPGKYWDPGEERWISRTLGGPTSGPGGQRTARPPDRPLWSVTVSEIVDVTPDVKRVRFGGENLEEFTHEAAADFVLFFPSDDGQPVTGQSTHRHYTTRRFDPIEKLLDVDFVLHGDGPGVRWISSARPGDRMEISGPLVRRSLDPSADWYLLVGDETAIPAVFGLAEALPATASALLYLEVSGPSERQPFDAQAAVEVNWLFRGKTPGDLSDLLIDALRDVNLPSGRGDVFLAGETGRIRALRQTLLAKGVARDQIFAMGYWRPGRLGGDEMVRD
ncbi:MAG: siderophore-interacting protein [Chloroflexi bacterium]|nr:siderophore-interacting protein [Chloroflexota bacterium]